MPMAERPRSSVVGSGVLLTVVGTVGGTSGIGSTGVAGGNGMVGTGMTGGVGVTGGSTGTVGTGVTGGVGVTGGTGSTGMGGVPPPVVGGGGSVIGSTPVVVVAVVGGLLMMKPALATDVRLIENAKPAAMAASRNVIRFMVFALSCPEWITCWFGRPICRTRDPHSSVTSERGGTMPVRIDSVKQHRP
jgi:hypothetical protein